MIDAIRGNAREVGAEELHRSLGDILADDEFIDKGFKMVRDLLVFTNKAADSGRQAGRHRQKGGDPVHPLLMTSISVRPETPGAGATGRPPGELPPDDGYVHTAQQARLRRRSRGPGAEEQDADGEQASGGWLRVSYNGNAGWISAAYVTTQGNCS